MLWEVFEWADYESIYIYYTFFTFNKVSFTDLLTLLKKSLIRKFENRNGIPQRVNKNF